MSRPAVRTAAVAVKRHPLVCVHEWVIAAKGSEYAELCVDCGAGCTRDAETHKIVAFDARLPGERDRRGGKGASR